MPFEKATLIKYLRKMGVFWTGEIEIQITEFNDYVILEAAHTDTEDITEVKTGLFRSSKYIELPKGSSLRSVNKVYKKT